MPRVQEVAQEYQDSNEEILKQAEMHTESRNQKQRGIPDATVGPLVRY